MYFTVSLEVQVEWYQEMSDDIFFWLVIGLWFKRVLHLESSHTWLPKLFTGTKSDVSHVHGPGIEWSNLQCLDVVTVPQRFNIAAFLGYDFTSNSMSAFCDLNVQTCPNCVADHAREGSRSAEATWQRNSSSCKENQFGRSTPPRTKCATGIYGTSPLLGSISGEKQVIWQGVGMKRPIIGYDAFVLCICFGAACQQKAPNVVVVVVVAVMVVVVIFTAVQW